MAVGQVRGHHQIRVIRAVDSAYAGLVPGGLGRRRIGVSGAGSKAGISKWIGQLPG
jgi:hypothetical protein